MERDEREYVLLTAGVRKAARKNRRCGRKFSVIKTLQAIEDAHVVLLVIDAREDLRRLSLLGITQ